MILLILSFVAGILTVLAPCILPLLPVIIGGSLLDGKVNRKRAFTITISLSVSIIVFTLLLKASTLLIAIPPQIWSYISGGIIFVFGFIMIFPGLWEKMVFANFLNRESNKLLSEGYQKKNIAGDILIGIALGPVFSSCSPTYFIILATVLPEKPLVGFGYLLVYTLGLSLMLLLISLFGQRIMEKLGVAADPRGLFKKIIGFIFVLVGLAIIIGIDKRVEANLLNSRFFDITKIEQRLLELKR